MGFAKGPDATTVKISKYLSRILRHDPARIGLQLDAHGWADVGELLAKSGMQLDLATLRRVVAENDKQRFTFSPDGSRIRAAQGHSIAVDLALEPVTPPEILYHGTARQTLDPILREGLVSGRRQQVHLSGDVATALKVGQRHGKPVVLTVAAGQMHRDGLHFWQADNGVWLVDAVPPVYLAVASGVGDARV